MRNSHKLNVWLALFTLTLVAMFGVGVSSSASIFALTPTTSIMRVEVRPILKPSVAPICPPNCAQYFADVDYNSGIDLNFRQYFIVKLTTQFKNEEALSIEERTIQRKEIKQSLDNFARQITSSPSIYPINFGITPYAIVVLYSPADLEKILSIKEVMYIERFNPLSPTALMGLDKVYLEIDSNTVIPPTYQSSMKAQCEPVDMCEKLSKNTYTSQFLGVELSLRHSGRWLTLENIQDVLNYKAKILILNQIQQNSSLLFSVYPQDNWISDLNAYTSHPNLVILIRPSEFGKLLNNPYVSKIRVGEPPTHEKKELQPSGTYFYMDFIDEPLPSIKPVPAINSGLTLFPASYTPTPLSKNVNPVTLNATPEPGANLVHIGLNPNSSYRGQDKAIALIDLGVLINHPALAGRIATHVGVSHCLISDQRKTFEKCLSITDPNPCYPLDVTATAAATRTLPAGSIIPTPIDLDGICSHGTWISGPVVGSVSGTRVGVAVAPDLKIIPFRLPSNSQLLPDNSNWEILNKIELYLEEIKKIVRVNKGYVVAVSISIGIPMDGRETWNCDDIQTNIANNEFSQMKYINETITELRDVYGIITFVAAGTGRLVGKPDFPGCLSKTVSVSAVNPLKVGEIEHVAIGDSPYLLSNSGIKKISDPGNELKLLMTGYGYGTNLNWQTIYSGVSSTSMAAPQAAAAFALYRERHSSLSPEDVLKIFLSDANKAKVPDPRVVPVSISGTIVATLAKTVIPNVALMVKPETGRVNFNNLLAGARLYPNVNYDSPSDVGQSVTPPLSCDYLAAGQDCTLREAVAAALPQDVISFL